LIVSDKLEISFQNENLVIQFQKDAKQTKAKKRLFKVTNYEDSMNLINLEELKQRPILIIFPKQEIFHKMINQAISMRKKG